MSPILFWLFLPFIRGEGSRETLYDIFVCDARRLCAFNSWNFPCCIAHASALAWAMQARVRISVSMQRAGLLLHYTHNWFIIAAHRTTGWVWKNTLTH